MPNWCHTSYVVVGKYNELKALYNIFNKIESKLSPAIPNDFGSTWLGYVVNSLGVDFNEVGCRGYFLEPQLLSDRLTLCTETAWCPCYEVFELIGRKFPSLKAYYLAEEPGCDLYVTNDANGTYFPYRVLVNVNSQQTEYSTEHFADESMAFEWLSDTFDCVVKNESDVEALNEALEEENEDYFVEINSITIQ